MFLYYYKVSSPNPNTNPGKGIINLSQLIF
jgi:hypothetical protein